MVWDIFIPSLNTGLRCLISTNLSDTPFGTIFGKKQSRLNCNSTFKIAISSYAHIFTKLLARKLLPSKSPASKRSVPIRTFGPRKNRLVPKRPASKWLASKRTPPIRFAPKWPPPKWPAPKRLAPKRFTPKWPSPKRTAIITFCRKLNHDLEKVLVAPPHFSTLQMIFSKQRITINYP